MATVHRINAFLSYHVGIAISLDSLEGLSMLFPARPPRLLHGRDDVELPISRTESAAAYVRLLVP